MEIGVQIMHEEGVSNSSPESMFGKFTGELAPQLQQWRERLSQSPGSLNEVEVEVRNQFARGADLIVAGLINVLLVSVACQQAGEQTRRSFSIPLAKSRLRRVRLRLLGGLLIWVTSLYSEPRKGIFRRRQPDAHGLYTQLAALGINSFESPALKSHVARQAVLCPSLKFAAEELARGGLKLDVKTVRRIAGDTGNELLSLRRHEVEQFRLGKLAAGNELAGKRVSVQIDGGRVRLRSALRKLIAAELKAKEDDALVPGRSQTRVKRTFDAQWREPKLLIIFVHDEHGRMEKKINATVDGTLQGPDALAELVAMHLHRLGAAQAQSVTFVADGAPWIWDRLASICRLAKLDKMRVHEVLDNCHAVHHVSQALAGLGLADQERFAMYKQYRTLVRNGQWRQVVDEIRELAAGNPNEDAVIVELTYLRKHGLAGRLSYPHFRSLGLPLGSGAIESNIRRVLNLRLKSNAMYWREPMAEAMLQVRAHVVSGRWDSRMKACREHHLKNIQLPWQFESQPMSEKNEAENPEVKLSTNSQGNT